MRKLTLVLLSLLAIGAIAQPQHSAKPQTPQQPSVELPAELARVLRDYEKGWSTKDAAALASLFTEDGFVLSNGRPAVRGRAAIEKAYAGAGGPLALRAMAYSTDGNTGYIIGAFAMEAGKPDMGKFILALRNVGGRWMIAADMDNVNAFPPRPPQPPAAPGAPAAPGTPGLPAPPATPAPPAPPAPPQH